MFMWRIVCELPGEGMGILGNLGELGNLEILGNLEEL